MIETLRLGTRVTTNNPTWAHIRKIADSHRHTRYVFAHPTATAVVDIHRDPTGAVEQITTTPTRPLTAHETDTIHTHLTHDGITALR